MATVPRFEPDVLLRRARRIARLSQRELAERANVPVATLARIESGATVDPRVRTLATLFGALDCRLTVLSWRDRELPQHPWESERDYGDRHFPAHLDLAPVNVPYALGRVDWWGWYRSWAWQRGARIPALTFDRVRTPFYQPPLDPVTGEPIGRDEPGGPTEFEQS